MAYLMNLPEKGEQTLLDALIEETKATMKNGDSRRIYALSCYCDLQTIVSFSKEISKSIKKGRNGHVTSICIVVNRTDWVKTRTSISKIIAKIRKHTGLAENSIEFIPAYFPGQLLHAKGYAVISPRNRLGFLAVTSGNLTKQGMGSPRKKGSNVELLEFMYEPESFERFIDLIDELKEIRSVPESLLEKNNRLLLAVKLFSEGEFYHKWDGSLSEKVRFELKLSEKGKKVRKGNNAIFEGWSSAGTLSRDPLNLQNIFDNIPSPFPRRFWANYSIGTILGKWVPRNIAQIVDDSLGKKIEEYINEIKEITSDDCISIVSAELKSNIDSFNQQGLIEGADGLVGKWAHRVKEFRKNKDFIEARLFSYEKIPNIIDDVNNSLIVKCFDSLEKHLRITKPRGLKRIFLDAIIFGFKDDEFDFLEKLKDIYPRAIESFNEHNED